MSNEVYTIDLIHPTAGGSRRLKYYQSVGDAIYLGDDGVLGIVNDQRGETVQINPHAWLSITTENIDMTEDSNG